MFYQQNRHVAGKTTDQRHEIGNLAVSKALCRLIENQQARLLAQTHGNLQQPLMAIAEIAGKLVRPVGDPNPLQRLGHLQVGCGDVITCPPAQGQCHIFRHRQPAEHRCDLEGIGHAGADPPVCRQRGDVPAIKTHGAGACRDAAGQHADKGCLAGTVRPDQGAHLAGRQVEIDIVDRLQTTEIPAQAACRQQRHGSHLSARRRNSPTRPCGANNVSITSAKPAISM